MPSTRTARLAALEKLVRARADHADAADELRLHLRWSRIVAALADARLTV